MIHEVNTDQGNGLVARSDNEKQEIPVNRSGNIRTLFDYYRIEKLAAYGFFAAVKKNEIGKIQEDDKQRCLDSLDVRDPDFSKTLDLIYRGISTKTSLGRQCASYAWRACKQQLSVHHDLEIDQNIPSNVLFNEVLHVLKPGLISKRIDNRSLNLLKALGIWKSFSGNLEDIIVTEGLLKTLLPKKERRKGGDISNIIDILFRPTTRIIAMSDMLAIAESSISKAKLAGDAELREKQQREWEFNRAQSLLEKLKETNAILDKQEEEISNLKASLEKTKSENQSLELKIEHDQVVNTHGEGVLKGRSRVFLDKKITPLLETALEFAELNPPRKKIIIERLEMANEEIRKEIKWLRFTD